jgi:hypothetical protein
MAANYLKRGDWNVICDRTGFKIKASESRKEWNGLRVWKKHWEARQPQDKLRMYPDSQRVPDPRPESEDVFLGPNDITIDDLYL